MRLPTLILPLLLTAALLGAEPPTLTLPAKVEGGSFAVLAAVTDGKSVEYVALDKGLEFFPPTLLRDPKVAVVFGPKGAYRILAYTGTADGPSKPVYTTVVLGGSTGPVDPPKDPKDPPPPGTGKLYFFLIRPDGPAAPAFAKVMQDPAWGTLRTKGHYIKDFTTTEAAKFSGIPPVEGTGLPCVVTLRISADGLTSTVVRAAIPLPLTSDAILKLPEGVP